MSTSVLLSIKPKFADRIFDGTKRFEFRRKIFKRLSVTKVVVYVTAPVSKVIGEFEIDEIISKDIESLWEETKDASGIVKTYFETYFQGQDVGYAIKIGKVKVYDIPLELETDLNVKRAPQSFVYL